MRKFGEVVYDQWMMGPYTAKLNLSCGQGQKQLTSTVSFWIIPYKMIAIVLIGGITLFFVGRAGIRRYNARVIAKAQGSGLKIKR